MPFFPHRLRQFRNALGQSPEGMAKLLGMESEGYKRLELGTQDMQRVHQESFISRFGNGVYGYIHGERDQVDVGGKVLQRESAVAAGLEPIAEKANLNFDLKEVDGQLERFRDASGKDRERLYKKLLLAYKSLEAENQNLRADNNMLRQALVDAKEMMIKKFLKR